MIKIFILIISIACSSCINKNTTENSIIISKNHINKNIENVLINTNDNYIDDNIINNEQVNIIFTIFSEVFIAPIDGINLHSNPSISSTIIKLIPQNASLIINEISETPEAIESIYNYWYKVDTGKETGLVFGNYLSNKPMPKKIKNIKIANMLADDKISVSNDEFILSIKEAIYYNNRDTLIVYENSSKESNNILIKDEYVFLIKIDVSPGWYYLISSNYEAEGYIYIYDISEKSFYGNLEENKKSANYYKYLQNTEYEIISQNENIKRYGPLLTINQDGKTAEFLDTYYGSIEGKKYLLLDNYPEFNELLILEQYWESEYMFIFNLDSNTYSCKNIEKPYFNNTRSFMLSLVFTENIGSYTIYFLKFYKIAGSIYEELYNENINIDNSWRLQKIDWVNNNEVHIDYGESGKIIFDINNYEMRVK